MTEHVLIWMFSVFISAFSQVLLKIAAGKKYKSWIREYLNPVVIAAYSIFFLSMILTMIGLRVVPYSYSPIIESTGYIYIPILSAIMLKEKIGRRRILGIVIILIGIAIFAFPEG